MEIDIYHQDEEPITAEDGEYQPLRRDAAHAYAAEEIEAWQLGRAEAIASRPAATGEGGPDN